MFERLSAGVCVQKRACHSDLGHADHHDDVVDAVRHEKPDRISWLDPKLQSRARNTVRQSIHLHHTLDQYCAPPSTRVTEEVPG
eukprot:2962967-Rhodomonas_salina.1